MRLETAVEKQQATSLDFLFFGIAGLISGFGVWFAWPGYWPPSLTLPVPTGLQTANVSLIPPLAFVLTMGVAVFLTGTASRLEQSLLMWIAAAAATVGIYILVVALLFAGYFSQLFGLTGNLTWINFALCGVIGAGLVGLIVGTLAGVMANRLFAAMLICGAVSGLGFLVLSFLEVQGRLSLIFVWPWWQTSMGLLIGLWFSQPGEE